MGDPRRGFPDAAHKNSTLVHIAICLLVFRQAELYTIVLFHCFFPALQRPGFARRASISEKIRAEKTNRQSHANGFAGSFFQSSLRVEPPGAAGPDRRESRVAFPALCPFGGHWVKNSCLNRERRGRKGDRRRCSASVLPLLYGGFSAAGRAVRFFR